MESIRTPFQGVWNIVRFNWHFYLAAFFAVSLLIASSIYLPQALSYLTLFLSVVVVCLSITSLLVSYFVYDLSKLYSLDWLSESKADSKSEIVNIHSGFDETSALLTQKFPYSKLTVFDFYDPSIHTEVSIKRARKAYPQFQGTQSIDATSIPLTDNSTDVVFLLLAAHEIRNHDERITFFKEINRILKEDGRVIVTEHLRDTANFLAYNLGAFHFYSKRSWLDCFAKTGFNVISEAKLTPFISKFTLEKNGIPR